MNKLILGLTALLLTFEGFSQKSLSLEEALNFGMENNPEVLSAKLELNKARFQVNEFRGMGLPQVSLNGSFNHFLDIPVNLVPAQFFNPAAGPDEYIGVKFGTDYSVKGGLQVNQLLFDGTYLTGLKAAKKYPELSALSLKKTEADVKKRIESAYYNAAVAEYGLTLLGKLAQANDELAEKAKAYMEAGVADSSLYDQLTYATSNVKTEMQKASNNYQTAIKMLLTEIGDTVNNYLVLTDKVDQLVNTMIVMDTTRFNIENLPAHQLLTKQIELQQLNLEVNKNRYYPQLVGFFSHEQQALRNEFDFFGSGDWFPTTVWGLQLKVPIFTGGTNNAKVKQAEIDIQQAELNIQQADAYMKLQFEAAKNRFNSAVEVYRLQKENIALTNRIFWRTKTRYESDMASVFDYSQAQTQQIQAQTALIGAMMEIAQAYTELKNLMNAY